MMKVSQNWAKRKGIAMRGMFLVLAMISVLSNGGCARNEQPEEKPGIEIHAPGVDIKIDKNEGVNVKAPNTEVHVSKEKGTEVKAPGVDLEAQPQTLPLDSDVE